MVVPRWAAVSLFLSYRPSFPAARPGLSVVPAKCGLGEFPRQRCSAGATPAPAPRWRTPLASSRLRVRIAPVRRAGYLMVDYQFLGLVAVGVAVLTRGALLPVVAVTAFVALVLLGCELGARWYRNRRPRPAGDASSAAETPDGELNRWMTAVERVLGSAD